MGMRGLGAGVMALLVLAGCTSGARDAPSSANGHAAVSLTDVPYATESPAQKLDLSVPAHTGPVPVVVVIHGGSFARGDKRDVLAKARALGDAGLAAASIDYRLSDEARFPAAVDDARASVAWLRVHAGEYGLDPSRIAVWGMSAGGYLAAMTGVASASAPQSAVSAVVDWYGISDFRTLGAQAVDPGGCGVPSWRTNRLVDVEKAWLGATVATDPELGARSSPVSYVAKGRALPPFLLVHGAADCLVPYGQSQQLAKALTGVGGSARLVLVPGADHSDPVIADTQTEPSIAFLKKAFAR